MINRITRTIACLDHFPVIIHYGNDWNICPFCQQVGMFPYGNGGIVHTDDCAIKLSERLTGTTNYFDALAYKSILHQLMSMSKYPVRRIKGRGFVRYCPFCYLDEPKDVTIQHAETCIMTLAQQELSSAQSSEAVSK